MAAADAPNGGRPPTEEEEKEEEEEALAAESIRARREAEGGVDEFLVRWKKRTWEDDTWVTRERLDDEIVEPFMQREQREAARKQAQQAAKPEAPAGKKRGISFMRF